MTGVRSRQRQRIFRLASVSRPVLRPTQPPVQWIQESFPGGKAWQGRDADHSPHLVPRSRISGRLHGGRGTAFNNNNNNNNNNNKWKLQIVLHLLEQYPSLLHHLSQVSTLCLNLYASTTCYIAEGPNYEDACGSQGSTYSLLALLHQYDYVVLFTSILLYSWGKMGGPVALEGPQDRSGRRGDEKCFNVLVGDRTPAF
jgi:hypothetical protein